MKILKNIILSGLSIVIVLLSAAVGCYLVVSDATLTRLLSNYIESATGTRISFSEGAEISRTLSPSLYATDFVIEEDGEYSVQISTLQLQINLPGLLSSELDVPLVRLGETRVDYKPSDSIAPPSLPDSLPLTPILRNIQIRKLAITEEGESVFPPQTQINELAMILSPEQNKYIAQVDIDLAGKEIHANAEFPRILEVLTTKQLPFSASAESFDITLSTSGNIDFAGPTPHITSSSSLEASDIAHIIPEVADFVIPGSLSGRFALAGSFEQLGIDEFTATWQGPQESVATVSGSIDNLAQMSGCEVSLDSHLAGGSWLAPVLPESMGPLQSADFSARLSCAEQFLAKVDEFSLRALTEDQLDLSLNGQLDLAYHEQDGVAPENIDLELKFSAPTTRTARVLFFDSVWEFGPIAGTGNIRSVKGDPAIENVSVSTKDPQGIEVDLAGRIAQFPLAADRSNTGYDLNVTMKSKQTSTMMDRFGMDLSVPGPLQISYSIEGDSQALQLNRINLSAGDKEQIFLQSTGELLFGDWSLENPLANIDLNIQATSSDTRTLEKLLGQPLPDLGPLSAKALLHTVSGKQRIDNFQLQTGEDSSVQISLKGSAEHSDFFIQPGIHGIQLQADITTEDTSQLNNVLGLQKIIPAIGPFKAAGEISGNHQKLTINNFTATAGQEEILLVDVQGDPGSFSAANDWRPKGTNLNIAARATNSHTFFDLLEIQIPELGPATAHAELKEKNNRLALQSTAITWGETDRPTLEAIGRINDLLAFTGVDFDLKLDLDSHRFAAWADNVNIPEMQPLTGQITVSDNDGTLGVDDFHLESIDEELLSFESKGHFDDFNNPDTLVMTTRLTARDLLLVGALFDLEWPPVGPVHLESKIKPVGETLTFDTTLTADELQLHSEIIGLFHTNPPQISGKILAQNFFLPLSLDAEADSTESEPPQKDHIFSAKPIDFDWLKKADLDLDVEIDSFDIERAKAKSGQFRIIIQSGKLKVSPAKLTYPVGHLDLEIELDAKERPEVRFEAYGENLNPWYALDMKGSASNKELDADLDVEIKVTSEGTSEKELASNLQGTLYLNLRNGKMRRSLLDLIFLDFVGWTLNTITADKYADVECGVADYKIENGVIDTQGLFIDSKAISIAGEGTIDLANEEIDYTFLPRKKSRLIKRADPVNIKGPLSDPSITTIPLKTAISTYGTLFFAPYLFVGIYAADLVTDVVPIGKDSSPCLEYERKHAEKEQPDVQ